MKKTALIVLISLAFSADGEAQANEEVDSIFQYTRYGVYAHISFLSGFEIVDSKNAMTSVATPLGLDFRNYFKKKPYNFLQVGVSGMPIIVRGNDFTTYVKFDGAYGFIRPFATHIIGVNYQVSPRGFGNLIGVDYSVKMQGIPICLMYDYNLKNRTSYCMIGLNVPVKFFEK